MPRLMLAVLLAVLWGAGSATAQADIAGSWTFEVESPQGPGTRSMELEQDGSTVTGTTTAGGGATVDVSGTVDGNAVELSYTLDAAAVGALTITVTGDGGRLDHERDAGLRRDGQRQLYRPQGRVDGCRAAAHGECR